METLFIGRQKVELEEVGSTNSFALNLIRENKASEGCLIYTRSQSGGRGQQGNSWEAESGKNLTISVVLTPVFLPVGRQFALSQATSLALAALAEELIGHRSDVRIKWPNDIYVGDRKIAGILIENVLRDQVIAASVLGIGLNVNQEKFLTAPRATSFKMITGKDFDLNECRDRLCSLLEARYLQLMAGRFEQLASEYHSKLFRLNEEHTFASNGALFKAAITGVSESGLLKLQTKSEGTKEFNMKEVQFEW
jgi:BirA family biotin operon repressor/biotin-[acetyl-CoA-carboxylase] ligase